MKKITLSIGLLGCLLLPLATNAQQANTHGAQANAVPQVWKTNMDAAKSVEGVLNALRRTAEAGTKTGLPADFHYNVKEWTQEDITSFAKCSKTFDFYEAVLGIGNAAVATDGVGNYTADALEAQKALTYLKPNCCKSWKGFYNMIADASDATETLRAQYHREIDARKKG